MEAREVTIEEKEYEDMLNETYGDVEICGLTYAAGYALREVDPVAFRCGLSDYPLRWQCSECDTIYDDIDEAEECCFEEEEEEEDEE